MNTHTSLTAVGCVHAMIGILIAAPSADGEELSKGHRILKERGLQVQAMVNPNTRFDLNAYKGANYSGIYWIWDSNHAQLESDPDFPWARWVGSEESMPFTSSDAAYSKSLVALQFSDEMELNSPDLRDRAVNWFNTFRDQFPNTLLHMNNSRGQVADEPLTDFITRARPDMLLFDDYPFRFNYETGEPINPVNENLTSWYGELRRYRVHANLNNIPYGIYRQTFQQKDANRFYRGPSTSEMSLNTFGALAFGATYLIDFTYNPEYSTLAPLGVPTPFHDHVADVNQRARLFGKALTQLIGIDDQPALDQPTWDILFLRGQSANGQPNLLPNQFTQDDLSPTAMSEWTQGRNDPYMTGFAVENLGEINDSLPGDVIVSWFKPLDSSLDDPADPTDQLYFFVVNGLTDPNGTAEDCRQRITIDFDSSVGESLMFLNPETGGPTIVELLQSPESVSIRQLVLELDGGDGMLFKFDGAGDFLGFRSGDANLDGDVNHFDLEALASSFGTADSATWAQGDFDLDGDVDLSDLATLASKYDDGHVEAMAQFKAIGVVPEPAGLGMIGPAIWLFTRSRQKIA